MQKERGRQHGNPFLPCWLKAGLGPGHGEVPSMQAGVYSVYQKLQFSFGDETVLWYEDPSTLCYLEVTTKARAKGLTFHRDCTKRLLDGLFWNQNYSSFLIKSSINSCQIQPSTFVSPRLKFLDRVWIYEHIIKIFTKAEKNKQTKKSSVKE